MISDILKCIITMTTRMYVFVMILIRTCLCSTVNLKQEEHHSGSNLSELVQFGNGSEAAESVSNTQKEKRTTVEDGVDKNAMEMDTKGACLPENGTFDDVRCVRYIQTLLQNQALKEVRSLDRVSRVLTDLTLPICLDGFKIVHFNPETQICCNGIISYKSENKTCCHGEVIDLRVHLCCNEVKYERNGSNGCCGTFVFDTNKHLCCDGMLFNITQHQPCCQTSTEMKFPGFCCKVTSIYGKCMSCVNNALVETHLNDSTELCCEGLVKKRVQVCNSGNKQRHVIGESNRNSAMTRRNHESDDIIVNTIKGSLAAAVAVLTLSGITVGYLKYYRRYNVLHMCLKKGVVKQATKLNLISALFTATDCSVRKFIYLVYSAFNKAPDSLRFHRTQVTEDYATQEPEIVLPLVGVDASGSEALNLVSTSDFAVIDLDKFSLPVEGNLKTDHFVESHTQTMSNVDFERTIFGTPFDCTYMLDESNPVLQMRNSDAQMTLPVCMKNAGKVEVSASTFRNIERCKQKLGLSCDESLASPIVEYAMKGNKKLDGYACVRLPFVGKSTSLKVKKFESDEGLQTVATSTEIPQKGKQNEDLDAFYILEGSTVLIYTKSFSGFYCTRCKCIREEELDLIAFVFGSYRYINESYEVFITVYVADILFMIEDFKKELFENEINVQERICLRKDIRLDVPDCDLDGNDFLEVSLTLKPNERKWMHQIHPTTGQPVYPLKKKIKLAAIAQKCQKCLQLHTTENKPPVYKQWYLCNVKDTVPSDKFQCFIDLAVFKKGSDVFAANSIVIDELRLQQADRRQLKETIAVQETAGSFAGACAYDISESPSRERGAVADIPLSGRQSYTLVRAESVPNLLRHSSSIQGRSHVPPGPELSHVYETMPYQALPHTSTLTSDEQQT